MHATQREADDVKTEADGIYRCNGYTIREKTIDGKARYDVMSKRGIYKPIASSPSFSDAADYCRSH